mgnify:CR=1 FL=1
MFTEQLSVRDLFEIEKAGNPGDVEKLLDKYIHDNVIDGPVLHVSSQYGYVKIIELLLKKGFDVDAIHEGMTPLSYAVFANNVDVAQLLLKNGADLRAIQQMLGHESITTTEIYTHLDKNFLRETIAMHHPRYKNKE